MARYKREKLREVVPDMLLMYNANVCAKTLHSFVRCQSQSG